MRLLVLFLALVPFAVQAQPADFYLEGNKYVTASIVSDSTAFSSIARRPPRIGIRLEIAEGWHIYWNNSGESGLPTVVDWDLPAGLKASKLRWPAPYRLIEKGDITTFGYHDEVILVSDLIVEADGSLPESEAVIAAEVSWLVCEEVCVPGRISLSRTFPTILTAAKDSNDLAAINHADSLTPEFSKKHARLSVLKTTASIEVVDGSPAAVVRIADIKKTDEQLHLLLQAFPHSSTSVKFLKPVIRGTPSNYAVALPFETVDGSSGRFPALSGTIVLAPRLSPTGKPTSLLWRTAETSELQRNTLVQTGPQLEYRLIDKTKPAADANAGKEAAPAAAPAPRASVGLLAALLASFVAGLLLNIMPCVLPVISIKIMSFMEGAGQDASINRKSAAAFSLGIILSFLSLAALVVLLRELGHQVGWGFQFQYPGFVLALTIVVFVLALGFFEVYTIHAPGVQKLSTKADSLTNRYAKNFADGILATLLATPCAAPFLGTALAFAFSQPTHVVYLVFLFIGIGLALPYALVASSTRMLAVLPKPGAWMFKFREFMGFLLLATVIWLIYVLSKFSDIAATAALCILLSMFLCFRLYHWVQESEMKWFGRALGKVFVWVLCFASIGYGWQTIRCSVLPVQASENSVKWADYSDALMTELADEGQPVFLDFTAAWCITCKANEKLVLSTDRVQRAFNKHGVKAVKADWTTGDEEVGKALRSFGGDAVPYYVVIPADRTKTPIVLPTVLTPSIVIEALKKL